MKRLKINFLSFILGIKWTLIFILGYYFIIYLIFKDVEIFKMWYSHIFPFFVLLPDLYIIAGYLVEDFSKKIVIGNDYIIDETNEKKYQSNEIQKIVIHKPNSELYKIMSYMYYQFVEIKLKNNDKIIITSLMKSNIDEYLKENLKGVYFDRNFNNFL